MSETEFHEPFVPTDEQRDRVEIGVACGMSEEDIARTLKISRNTLRKRFEDEILNGRANKRLELYFLMWKNASGGNATVQKHLTQHMSVVDAGAKFEQFDQPEREPKLGKKELAQIAATTAGSGTEWGNDLRPPHAKAN